MLKLIWLLLLSISTFSATYYVDSAAASDAGDGSSGNPKKYIPSGISLLSTSGGDTLIVKKGTYSGSSNDITSLSHGASNSYNVITAQIDGEAILTGTFDVSGVSAYTKIIGLKFKSSASKGCAQQYVKFFRCAFEGGQICSADCDGAIVYGPGSYQLYEDCWFYGIGGRYVVMCWEVNNIVFRRCVARHDGGYTANEGNPEAVWANYGASNIAYINCISIDNDLTYTGDYSGSFYCTGHVSNPPSDSVAFIGCIDINGQASSWYIDTDDGSDGISFTDCVAYNNAYGIGMSNTGIPLTITRVTIGEMTSAALGLWSGTMSIINSVVWDHVAISGSPAATYTNGYNPNSFSGTGVTHYDPETNGLEYLIKIEDGSTLKTLGSSGEQMGAQIIYKIGTSGTLYGESGYVTSTGQSLWPWPYEARIKTDFASVSGGNRGFCIGNGLDGNPQTLTHYIWEQLGNQFPGVLNIDSIAGIDTVSYGQTVKIYCYGAGGSGTVFFKTSSVTTTLWTNDSIITGPILDTGYGWIKINSDGGSDSIHLYVGPRKINMVFGGQSNCDTIVKYKDTLVNRVQNANPGTTVQISSYCVGGSGLLTGSPNWSSRGSGTYLSQLVGLANAFDSLHYFVWYQGEADANAATVTDSIYKSGLKALFDDFHDSVTVPHGNLKFLVVQPRSGYTTNKDFWFYQVGLGIWNTCGNDTVFFAGNATGLKGGDGANFIHLTSISARKLNKQIGNTINYTLGRVASYLPPQINNHKINKTRDTITVHTTVPIVQRSRYTGFVFKDDADTIIPTLVSSVNDTTIRAVFSHSLKGTYTIKFGIEQLPNDSCDSVPIASNEVGAILLPYKGYELSGGRGIISYAIGSYQWGLGNGASARYSGYEPTYNANARYTSKMDRYDAASGHLNAGSRYVLRGGDRADHSSLITNDTLTIGGEQHHTTFMTRFRFVYYNGAQEIYEQYLNSTNYFNVVLLTGFILQFRYYIAGTYYQARTNAKTDMFISDNDYLLACRVATSGLMTIDLINETADTVVPITYGYQNNATVQSKLTARMIVGNFDSASTLPFMGDILYAAFFNEYLPYYKRYDDSLMAMEGWSYGDSGKYLAFTIGDYFIGTNYETHVPITINHNNHIFNELEICTLICKPDTGWASVYGTDTTRWPSGDTIVFSVTKDSTVTITDFPLQYSISITVTGDGTVDTLPSGKNGLFTYGELCTLIANYGTDTLITWSNGSHNDTLIISMTDNKSTLAHFSNIYPSLKKVIRGWCGRLWYGFKNKFRVW